MIVSLVAVKFNGSKKEYLYEAPMLTHLSVGDLVLVENKQGEDEVATVVKVANYVDNESDEYDMICAFANATTPLSKIKAYYTRREFSYDEEK